MPSGKAKETCGAKKATAPGHFCTLSKGWGTNHPGSGRCKWHGGNTSTGKTAAAREEGVRMLKYTSPHEIEPHMALLDELYRTAGHVQWLDDQMKKWELNTEEEIPPNQQHWMKVHLVERAHMVRVAKTAIDAGIAERQVRLAEQQGMVLAIAIERILDSLKLTSAQLALVPQVVPQILRQVSLENPVVVEGG